MLKNEILFLIRQCFYHFCRQESEIAFDLSLVVNLLQLISCCHKVSQFSLSLCHSRNLYKVQLLSCCPGRSLHPVKE